LQRVSAGFAHAVVMLAQYAAELAELKQTVAEHRRALFEMEWFAMATLLPPFHC
jgi:hypothetical protein